MTFSLPSRLFSLSLLSLSLAVTGCGPSDAPGEEAAAYTEAHEEAHEEAHAHDALVSDAHGDADEEMGTMATCTGHCDNCVLYARCKAPGLPFNLTYWSEKKAVVNSNHAHPGCVAMISTSHQYGHAAYVSAVDTAPNPNRITLQEANWKAGACSSRSGSKVGLNIYNFWCPKSAHGSKCAGPM